MKPQKQEKISFSELVKRRISYFTKNETLQQVDLQNYLKLNKAQAWRLWHGRHMKDTYSILQKLDLVKHPENEMEIDPEKLKQFPERFQNLIRVLVTNINAYDPELIFNLLDIIPDRWNELQELIPARDSAGAENSSKE